MLMRWEDGIKKWNTPVSIKVNYDYHGDECLPYFITAGCDVSIWQDLTSLGFAFNCDQNNCSKCIPPNSSSTEINNLHQLLYMETYVGGKQYRQQTIQKLLQNNVKNDHQTDTIILMVFNYGFSFLFSNWVCSLQRNHIEFLHKNTLIIVSDNKSYELVRKHEFNMVLNIHEITTSQKLGFSENASKHGLVGPFKPLVTFQMIILADLIEMEYDVMMCDIDMIFNKDPLAEIKNKLLKSVDIWTMLAPRFDSMGIANTGVIIMKSNCKTKTFMQTMMKHITIIYEKNDQIAFNYWLHWKPFRQIVYTSLNRKLWIPGTDIVLGKTSKKDIDKYLEFILFHAYGTHDHFDKIHKFHQIGQWYFTKQICPKLFNQTALPDLQQRDVHKILTESTKYLLNHNLITDKNHLWKNKTQ